MAEVSRMRTIAATVKYFKDNDPDTVVGEYLLRKMIKTGELPVVMAGNKALLNLDNLIAYFNGTSIPKEQQEDREELPFEYGKLRRVEL